MTDKAYIVANEQQEREVLEKLEREGLVWFDGGENPTEWIPSQKGTKGAEFPYVLLDDGEISWKFLNDLSDEEIAFDGRKESKMNISKEVYDALVEWKNNLVSSKRIYADDVADLYSENVIRHWWQGDGGGTDANNRLIAIIRWVNGEDIFEVEKPKKWVVRSKDTNSTYCYAQLLSENNNTLFMGFSFANATRFDTKEEAESWANAHQEVLEVEE